METAKFSTSADHLHGNGNSSSSAADIYRLYLDELTATKLLSPEEEVQLARRMRQGDEEARQHMIKANLRLVVKIARDYENCGLPLLDLISEGNIGLMKAVDRFDPDRGAKLSTYAAWWIKQAIRRVLANHSKTIRLPVHLIAKLSQLRRVETRLHQQLEREPTEEELAEEFGAEADCIASWRSVASQPVSIDAHLADSEGATYGEVIPDENAEAPSQRLENQINHETVLRLLAQLPERSAEVLRWRFGFHGECPTLDDVGLKMQVSRERIRQIEAKALDTLRALMAKERKTRCLAA